LWFCPEKREAVPEVGELPLALNLRLTNPIHSGFIPVPWRGSSARDRDHFLKGEHETKPIL
jgi:hypothetical protein